MLEFNFSVRDFGPVAVKKLYWRICMKESAVGVWPVERLPLFDHTRRKRSTNAEPLVIPNKFADYTLSMNYLISARFHWFS